MNWGNRILFLYLGFVALIITLVVVSFNQNVDLVSSDYYAKELAFQSDIQKLNNANRLAVKPNIIVADKIISIDFSSIENSKAISGNILIYKPSNAKADHLLKISTDNGFQKINSSDFELGMYKVKIDWQSNDSLFLIEEVIVLN